MKNIYTFFAIACIGLWGCNKEADVSSNNIQDPLFEEITNLSKVQNGDIDDELFLEAIYTSAIQHHAPYLLIDDIWCIREKIGQNTLGHVLFANGTHRFYTRCTDEYFTTFYTSKYSYEYDSNNNTINWYDKDELVGVSNVRYFKENRVIVEGFFPGLYSKYHALYDFILSTELREELLNSDIEELTGA